MVSVTSLSSWLTPARQRKSRFLALVEPHSKTLYQTAYRLTGNQSDTEDLIQELFLRLYQKQDHWVHLDNPRPWFLRSLYNLYIDLYRKRRRTAGANDKSKQLDDLPYQLASAAEVTPLEATLDSDQQRLLKKALDHLDAEERNLIVLHLMEGYSLPEVAEIQQLPLGTLKSRLHRSKEKLKKLLLKEPFPSAERFLKVVSYED
ncbi:RNA polymerase sigma factor [Marinospirillum perlucidum]|uniref:RNA polymerase sigma factor n=1 Tax=Marinospirillum perlucidum TaxID=1982602 RepID=UPI000DF32EE6|nr:RNA polymerase sigma factor [Marinospirillum perlucidum]